MFDVYKSKKLEVGTRFISRWVENCIIDVLAIDGNDMKVKISRTDYDSHWFETWDFGHSKTAWLYREYYSADHYKCKGCGQTKYFEVPWAETPKTQWMLCEECGEIKPWELIERAENVNTA